MAIQCKNGRLQSAKIDGFIDRSADRGIRALPDGYIESILNKEFDELNIRVRKPGVLRARLAAYAAATTTTASYAKIRDDGVLVVPFALLGS